MVCNTALYITYYLAVILYIACKLQSRHKAPAGLNVFQLHMNDIPHSIFMDVFDNMTNLN